MELARPIRVPRSLRLAVLAGVAAAVAFVGAFLAGVPAASSSAASQIPAARSAADLQSAFESAVAQVLPTVVQITTAQGPGSGLVYDKRGDIVTNARLVGGDTGFQVTLATGGSPHGAHLVAAYPPDDLAVIRLDSAPANLEPARFGDSTALRTGQIVMAVGNPLGPAGSVTEGIVSGTGRTVTEPRSAGWPGATITDAVQISAGINPGNSGGALVDLDGKVVGIPTLAATDPQMGGAAPGIGFAIPSNTVTSVARQIIDTGTVGDVGRGTLGITARTVVDAGGQPAGVAVVATSGNGPAQRAALEPGDIITGIDHESTRAAADLTRALAQHKPGDQVTVSLVRSDGSTDVIVTLGQLP